MENYPYYSIKIFSERLYGLFLKHFTIRHIIKW